MRVRPLLLVVAVVVSALPGTAPVWLQGPEVPAIAVSPLTSPAPAGSSAPQLTISPAGPLLSWVERSGSTATLKYSERGDGKWSAPRTVASGGDWFVNWADVPSVLRLDERRLAAHWLQKSGPDPYAYDVRLSRTQDNGATWARSVTPHSDGTATEHGFASLFALPRGGLGLVWLDGRAMKPDAHHGGHKAAGTGGGAMSLRFAAFDANWKQTSETLVDARVCECCPTAAAMTADGPVAAFRDRTEGEVRDIHVVRFVAGAWTRSRAVHDDSWKIAACPVNGPALSADGLRVALAWFTAAGDHGRAFLAFSEDAGRTFGAPVRLDDDVAIGRVDVQLLPDGSAVAGYIEHASGRPQFRIRRVARSGARSAAVTVADLEDGRASGYPRLAFHAGELVLAWTARAGDTTRVLTAAAAISRETRPLAAFR